MQRVLPAVAAALLCLPALAQESIPSHAPQAPPVLGTPPEAAAPAATRLPERVSGAPGTWDLSRDGTNFRCVLTLAAESGEAGRRVRFPAGCRRALPVTATVAGWLWTEQGLRLVDRNLRPLLAFTRRPDGGSLVARAESGEVYSFVPLDIAAMRPPEPEPPLPAPAFPADPAAPAPPPAAPAPQVVPAPQPTPQTAGTALPAGPEPGLYALDRYRDRDTCRLDLTAEQGVRILQGCRDGGITVFDPASWSFAAGRLTLKARRGHTVGLVPTGDGGWRRDPETGSTFVLRRVEP